MRKLMPSEADLAGYAGAPGGVLFKDFAPVRRLSDTTYLLVSSRKSTPPPST